MVNNNKKLLPIGDIITALLRSWGFLLGVPV